MMVSPASLVAALSPEAPELKFRLTDSTLRDGSHALAHRFSPEQVYALVDG